MRSVADALPLSLYRAAEVRELDRVAIEELGIPGFTLMSRAARATFRVMLSRLSCPEALTVYCGTGNNGGDGYVIATLAHQRGVPVRVVQLGDVERIRGDALTARERAIEAEVLIEEFAQAAPPVEGVIVDALLGTGLSGEVRGDYAAAIAAINRSGCPVVAVDTPSGLCADTGKVLGVAVVADCTVSYIGMKQGLLTGAAPEFVGQLYFSDLMVPPQAYWRVAPSAQRVDLKALRHWLAPRAATAHKGHFGHVMVVGGDLGMAGAAMMSSQAAGRVGAGLVSCATRPEHIAALLAHSPEVMAHGVVSGQEVEPLLERASVLVVGPGLGRQSWGEQLLQKACQLSLPMVLDADALNLLSEGRVVTEAQRSHWILTPHPGEAARLLGCSTAEINADRFAAATALQQRYGGVVILKGCGTVIASDAGVRVSGYGNPGMASGGMGDVLSGILGGLLAQGIPAAAAAALGVALHGRAADLAASSGQRGLLATDLIPYLRPLVNPEGAA